MDALPLGVPIVVDMNQTIPRWRNGNQCQIRFPISEYDWRIPGEVGLEVMNFHRKVMRDFSITNVVDIVHSGNRLVETAGSLDKALCLFQEVEFRKLAPQREYIRQNSSWAPHLAEEMEEIMRIGVTANYQRPPPVSPRRKGFHYKDKETLEFIEKLWPDIRKGRMFICGADCVGGDNALIEATPPTLLPKRNPDRSWSSDKRAIEDLRRINLYFENETSTQRHCLQCVISPGGLCR